MRLRCLLGRREKPLRLLRDLLEHSGIYILIFDDPGLLRNILMIRLHRPAFTVSFTVENSGSVFGGEVRSQAAGLLNSYSFTKKKLIFKYIIDSAALCEFPSFRC